MRSNKSIIQLTSTQKNQAFTTPHESRQKPASTTPDQEPKIIYKEQISLFSQTKHHTIYNQIKEFNLTNENSP